MEGERNDSSFFMLEYISFIYFFYWFPDTQKHYTVSRENLLIFNTFSISDQTAGILTRWIINDMQKVIDYEYHDLKFNVIEKYFLFTFFLHFN